MVNRQLTPPAGAAPADLSPAAHLVEEIVRHVAEPLDDRSVGHLPRLVIGHDPHGRGALHSRAFRLSPLARAVLGRGRLGFAGDSRPRLSTKV